MNVDILKFYGYFSIKINCKSFVFDYSILKTSYKILYIYRVALMHCYILT